MQIEILALRHQPAVLKRRTTKQSTPLVNTAGAHEC